MVIDIIFLIFLALGIIKGFRNGLIKSIFSILALFIGVIGALKFAHLASIYLHEWFDISSKYLPLISFLAVFILIIILVTMLSRIVEGLIKFVQLGLINKAAGAILWAALSTFIFSTILWFLYQAELISPALQAESKAYGFLEPISPFIMEFLANALPFLEGIYHSLELYFNQLYTEAAPVTTL